MICRGEHGAAERGDDQQEIKFLFMAYMFLQIGVSKRGHEEACRHDKTDIKKGVVGR